MINTRANRSQMFRYLSAAFISPTSGVCEVGGVFVLCWALKRMREFVSGEPRAPMLDLRQAFICARRDLSGGGGGESGDTQLVSEGTLHKFSFHINDPSSYKSQSLFLSHAGSINHERDGSGDTVGSRIILRYWFVQKQDTLVDHIV